MTADLFGRIVPYAEELTVYSDGCAGGRSARGFVQPLAFTDAEDFYLPAIPGRVSGARYLLVAEPDAIVAGETGVRVAQSGLLYEALRIAPFGINGGVSHWEGVLKLKGEAADA